MKKFFYVFVWREKVCITPHKKAYFLFPNVLKRWSFQKNLTGIWSFLYYQERGYFFFPKIWSYSLDTKGKMIFLKKYLEICFLQMFGKDCLSKKIAPEHDLFCNILKDGISFFQKIFFFFRPKMKEDGLYQKTHGKMIFSVYMGRCYRCDVTLLTKKQRYPCHRKIHPRVTSLASPKKMIFILENMVFLLKYHIAWCLRKGSRSSQQGCSTRKGVLRNFEKLTEKDLCQSLFFYKVTNLGVQLYLSCNFIKKEAIAQVFSCKFCEISKKTCFLQNTPGRLLLEFQLFSVSIWKPL